MKKMSKGMLMTALICGAVYMGATPVYANDVQEFTLDEYVVTAARTETKLVDTPANISVVDAKTIEERHYQDVSEVLKDVPGANVLDSGVGAYEKVIKLNGDERVLVLVDGRRINTDMGLTNSARSSVDMNMLPDVGLIERIEVLKGAGGALYGSDAVGGVVNIITKKADRSFGKVSIATGSMGAEDYNAMYSIKEDRTGVTVSASKYEQDYYKYRDAKSNTTTKWKYPSEFENEKVSLKVDYEINKVNNLTVGYDYSQYDGMSPTIYGLNKQEKDSKNLYAKLDWLTESKDNGYLQIYHNEVDYTNLGVYDPWGYPLTVGYFNEKSFGIDAQHTFMIQDNNKLVVGASWRKADVKANGDNTYDESVENIALFINDIWELAPALTLNTGIRYDDHSEAGDDTTLSAGLNKKFNDYSHIYLNWSQVFKAPSTDDLYSFFPPGGMGGAGSYGNPNLKPETGDTWTIGYNTKLSDKTDIGINYFESKLEDAIDWKYTSSTEPTYVRNVDEQKKRGMELTFNHELNNNLDLTASYTYIRVENNDESAGFVRDAHYHPNTYRLGINYHEGKWDANAWLRYGSGCDTTVDQYGYGDYADSNYLTVDVAVIYKANKDLSIYAKGYNLFNEAYAEQAGTTNGSYDYPAQSRRFIIGAEYKF